MVKAIKYSVVVKRIRYNRICFKKAGCLAKLWKIRLLIIARCPKAMRFVRAMLENGTLIPKKWGLGFSAGGHLVYGIDHNDVVHKTMDTISAKT
jgi:hypothetical protein